MSDYKTASTSFDPRYIEARRVLLDALMALAPHGRAFIVAGAQAVYLRTGDTDFAIAPYTTDGDLALNPLLLGDDPALEQAMTNAGFSLQIQPGGHVEPGIWVARADIAGQAGSVPVDLIVPEGIYSGGGRRGARLGVHGSQATRRAIGLEAALVDHGPLLITALDKADSRTIEAEVAGPTALLIAKAHKIHDRTGDLRANRLRDKDAADVVRLMQTFPASDIRATLVELSSDSIAGPIAMTGHTYLDELFGRRGRPGIEMAARALRLNMDAETVEVICVSYLAALAPQG